MHRVAKSQTPLKRLSKESGWARAAGRMGLDFSLSPWQCFLNLEWGFLIQPLSLFTSELPRNRRKDTKNISFVISLFFFIQSFFSTKCFYSTLEFPFIFLVCSCIQSLDKHLLSRWYVLGTVRSWESQDKSDLAPALEKPIVIWVPGCQKLKSVW